MLINIAFKSKHKMYSLISLFAAIEMCIHYFFYRGLYWDIRIRMLILHCTFTYITRIFTSTAILHVQYGGRKTSPLAGNQWCYYFLCVRFTLMCMASMHGNVIFSPKSLFCHFGAHVLDCILETFCSFTRLCF